jgi:ATP-dependent DNA ligase
MKLERPKFHNYPPGEFPSKADGFDLVELKYDGWWGQLVLAGSEWKLFSRTGQLKKFGVLTEPVGYTVLHGEYCFGTEWSKDHPEYYDQIAVHSAEIVDGEDVRQLDLKHSRAVIREMLGRLRRQPIQRGLFIVKQWPIGSAPSVWKHNEEFEGLVFKNSAAPWGSPYGRMKRGVTMDYICLGFEQSESDRHAGWGVASVLGGLIPAGKDTPRQVCKAGGLNDEARKLFFEHPEKFVGKVFEAEGKKITKSGALRHPNFVRWRTDKKPSECVWQG